MLQQLKRKYSRISWFLCHDCIRQHWQMMFPSINIYF